MNIYRRHGTMMLIVKPTRALEHCKVRGSLPLAVHLVIGWAKTRKGRRKGARDNNIIEHRKLKH